MLTNLIPPEWRFLAAFILLLSAAGLGALASWWFTATYYEKVAATKQVEADKQVRQQLVETQQQLTDKITQINKAGEQHAKDQTTITNLHLQLDSMRSTHIPTNCGMPASQSSTSPDQNAGVFPNRVDESFAKLRARANGLFFECDQLNDDAISANSANSQ